MPVRNKQAVDVRDVADVPTLVNMIHNGPITFVLVYADWCGHCQHYKPLWKKFENMPGRRANIASVHHDMLEKVPEIANAKIQGYPSVIKVEPNGNISEYKVPGSPEATNAVPFMRDETTMKKELSALKPISAPLDSKKPGPQAGISNVHENIVKEASIMKQSGGFASSVIGSIVNALQTVGPAAVLLAGYTMLPKNGRTTKTYKSPKRSNRRASTRKNRSQ
jgi:thiol-disulfide isomerase/thioredoxin